MSDDEMTITFEKDENIEGFVKALDLKDGNLYLVIKPEEDGFQIIGADKLPLGTGNEISTKMYILFAGLMHMATEQQDLVMEAGNYAIGEEIDKISRYHDQVEVINKYFKPYKHSRDLDSLDDAIK